MNPINYAAQFVNPAKEVYSGYATGLNAQGAQQTLRMNDAAEARARELHPLAMEGQRLGMDLQAQANDRANVASAQGTQAFNQQMSQAQEDQARQEQFQAAMGALAQLGAGASFDDYAQIAAKFPEFRDGIMETWNELNDNRKAGMSEVMGQVAVALQSGSPDRAVALLDQYAAAAENSGDAAAAATAKGLSQLAKTSPEAAMASLGATLATVDPTLAQQVLGGGGARVQTTEMIGARVSVQTMSDGTTRVVDTVTNEVLTGDAAAQAIEGAEAAVAEAERLKNFGRGTGSNEADIATGGEAAGAIKAAGIAQDVALKAFENIGKIQSNIDNLDRAISALDEGAKTGQIESRVPTWNAATLELRQLQSELGLDIIGSVTFGALSEGELRLALATALPANMQEDDLRAWLVDKKAAQEKLAEYMNQQAQFLSRPETTISDWLEHIETNKAPSQPAPIAPGGPTPSVTVGNQSYLELLDD